MATVTKVGRKFFWVRGDYEFAIEFEFVLETWHQRTFYTPDFKLFKSEQDYVDSKESSALRTWLREFFSSHNVSDLPMESLRKIEAIIKQP